MKIKGVIFDFNGTLFWDTKLHNISWDIFFDRHNIKISDTEKHEKLHGKDNRKILKEFLDFNLTEEEIEKYSEEKEEIYRELCLRSGLNLAPGAREFLNFLKMKKIPYTIATASAYKNVLFYFESLKLEEYFDIEKVVYSNGSMKSKPDPEMYERAMKLLNLKNQDTLIFEDSISGIKAAENAKAGKIIIVNSNDENYPYFPYEKIKDFSEVDRSMFE